MEEVERDCKMKQNTFYTADYHAFHGNIIKYSRRDLFLSDEDKKELDKCGGKWDNGIWKDEGGNDVNPYKISQEAINKMNSCMVDNTNRIVGKDDILYVLGDIVFGYDKLKAGKEFRDRINCQNIHLIWGNHDNQIIASLFSSCHDMLEIKVNHQLITLNHYAMLTWNKSHKGAWQLYGHSHGSLEVYFDSLLPERRSMDVGVDNAYRLLGEYRPFSFDEIKNILGRRKGYKVDHHNNKTT